MTQDNGGAALSPGRDLAVWFTPIAIRDHFHDDPDEVLLTVEEVAVGEMLSVLSDSDLAQAAATRITHDDIWNLFNSACADIVTEAWMALPAERKHVATASQLMCWVEEIVPFLESDKCNDWTEELDRVRPILEDLRRAGAPTA